MQRTFDKPYRRQNSTQWKWTMGILAAIGLVMLALVALTWNSPVKMGWVSDRAEAGFASTMMPDQSPVRIAAQRAQ